MAAESSESKKSSKSGKSRRRKMTATTPEAPVFDTARGSVDIGPVVHADPSDLAKEIAAGEHDAYLSELRHADKARFGGRVEVQSAAAKRLALAGS